MIVLAIIFGQSDGRICDASYSNGANYVKGIVYIFIAIIYSSFSLCRLDHVGDLDDLRNRLQ